MNQKLIHSKYDSNMLTLVLIQQTRTKMTEQDDLAIFLLALHALCNARRIAVFPGINPRSSGENRILCNQSRKTQIIFNRYYTAGNTTHNFRTRNKYLRFKELVN